MKIPARNISTIYQSDNSVFFRATCVCCSPDHDHSIIIDFDSDIKDITVSIYQQLEFAQYLKSDSKFRYWRKRIMNAINYLFTGKAVAEGHFIMSHEAAKDYAEAIIAATAEIKKNNTRHAK